MSKYEFIYGSESGVFINHKRAFGITKIDMRPSEPITYTSMIMPFGLEEKYGETITEEDYEEFKKKNKYCIFGHSSIHSEVFGIDNENYDINSITIMPNEIEVKRGNKIETYATKSDMRPC